MNVVAVPVKDLVNAKQRLKRALSAGERVELARAMLRDVLRALGAARVDAVWVVTRDAEVESAARAFAVDILGESENRGHTAAVALAQARALAAGAGMFLTLPGDVPCVTSAEVDELVSAAAGGGAIFAPSRSGLGTNAVALTPPDAMPLTFGEPSFDNHLAEARRRGLGPRVLSLAGIGLDIDAPGDLVALATEGAHTESGELLTRWRIVERLHGQAAGARE